MGTPGWQRGILTVLQAIEIKEDTNLAGDEGLECQMHFPSLLRGKAMERLPTF
jgi:hypothetical protein